MKLLFDTHAFIWWHSDAAKLSPAAISLCEDRANVLLLSVASVWEMQIKLQLRKLKLDTSLSSLVQMQRESNNVELLPITLVHVLALDRLPPHHKDPFDRLLMAQATVEDAVLVTNDPVFGKYPVKLLW